MSKNSAENLSRMIQCASISLSHKEDTVACQNEAFSFLHKTLEELYPHTHSVLEKTHVGSYSFFMRWKGKNSSRSMVLMAHQDVVPAGKAKFVGDSAEGWTFAPFSGEIVNGQIRGRGTLDDKSSLCGIFEAVEDLLVEGFVPEIDVYICSSHNEETMGWGAPAIVEELQKRGIKPELVLDEGGAIVPAPLPLMKGQSAMIGLCEKGVADVLFTAKSKGGHASAPPKKTPLGQLGAFVASIEKKSPFRASVTPALQTMFTTVAPKIGFPLNILFRFPRFFSSLICGLFTMLGGEPRAMVQTTCSFTMASGSSAINVLPDSASISANLRLLGGMDTLDSVIRDLQKRADKFNVEVSLLKGHEPSKLSLSDRHYKLIKELIHEQFPGVLVTPYIMIAASDSRHYCAISDSVYRFAPFSMNSLQRKSIHGFDEFIEIESFEKGIAFYKELIKRM